MNATNFPDEHVPVTSPQDLVRVLQLLRELVASGKLVPMSSSDNDFPTAHLADISDEGPWPDFLDMRFKGLAGQCYRLTVETFRGTGGAWSPDINLGPRP